MRPFWDYIEDVWEKSNMTMTELAKLTGISWVSLKAYQQRKTVPNLEYAHRILCALDVSMSLGVKRRRKDELLARAKAAAEDEE